MTRLCFDQCVIDTQRHELLVNDRVVEVQPLIFELLAFLAKNPRRVVSKDELLTSVWRSSFVTDSVLARAIMKARRAILDSAENPQTIVTVRGVGYRFDAPVQLVDSNLPQAEMRAPAPIAAARSEVSTASNTMPGLAVLPFFNDTGDASLSWVEHGLSSLVQHQLQARSQLQLVRAEAIAAWSRPANWDDDNLAIACRQLNCHQALIGRVLRNGPESFSLQFALGDSTDHAPLRSFEGSDLLVLAQKLVSEVEAACGADSAKGAESFWDEQAARVLDLAGRGESGKALTLLESSLPRISPDLPLRLVHARLLRDQTRIAESTAVAHAALDEAYKQGLGDLQAELLAELGRSAVISGAMHDAERFSDEALRLVLSGQASAMVLPNVLVGRGEQFRFKGQGDEAAKTAERAIAAAQATGDVYWELIAHCLLGHALMAMQQQGRALETLQKAAREARFRDLLRVELQAYLSLGAIQTSARLYRSALESLSRAATLAQTLGSRTRYITSQLQRIFTEVEAGNLAEASAVAARFREETAQDLPENSRESFERAVAHLLWRSGQHQQAIAKLTPMMELAQRSRWFSRWNSAALLCSWHLSLGNITEARHALEVLADDTNPSRRARGEAAVLLREGQRKEAIATLRMTWLTESSEGAAGQDLAVDLGWMLLEDGPSPELELLMTRVNAMSAEHGPTAMLQLAYARRRQGRAVDADWHQSWTRLMARFPALQRTCPHLGTLVEADFSRDGRQIPPLPLLLNNACD